MPLAAERSGLIRGVVADVGAAPPEPWGHRDCGGAIDPCEGPRQASSPRFLVRARGARHQVAAGVVAGRRCSYGDAADRQRDRANKGLPRQASSPRFLVRARGARHQVAAGVVAGRRCSYGDAADRQRDRANKGLTASGILSAFSRARARSPSSGGGGGRGRAPVQLRGCC